MRQWILLGLLGSLMACQSQSNMSPQPLLKSAGYLVYVNEGPPEKLAWEFQSVEAIDKYYARAVSRLKQGSGKQDAQLAGRQGVHYFLANNYLEADPKKPSVMGQVTLHSEEFSLEELNRKVEKCESVKRLEGLYNRSSYPQHSDPLMLNSWREYQHLATNYSTEWNTAMMHLCIDKD